MQRPWSTIFDDELDRLKLQASMLRETILIAAVWTGKSSREWDRLMAIAEKSGIDGIVDELKAIKRAKEEWSELHSGDPW